MDHRPLGHTVAVAGNGRASNTSAPDSAARRR